jgi:hypothetical protein
MLRVSESTSSFSEFTLLKPRALTAQLLEVCAPTWMPGTRRNASGMVVAPERRMISRVTTAMAAAASRWDSSVRDTEVTSTFMSSSKLMRFSWSSWLGSALFAPQGRAIKAPQQAIHVFDANRDPPLIEPFAYCTRTCARPTGVLPMNSHRTRVPGHHHLP